MAVTNAYKNQIQNRNFLSPVGFIFTLTRSPKIAFFLNSANIPDGTLKILVCSSMGVGSSHTIVFGNNKLITPNPLNQASQATRLTFKRQGQSAQLLFDAQGDSNQGSWILLSNGVYVT